MSIHDDIVSQISHDALVKWDMALISSSIDITDLKDGWCLVLSTGDANQYFNCPGAHGEIYLTTVKLYRATTKEAAHVAYWMPWSSEWIVRESVGVWQHGCWSFADGVLLEPLQAFQARVPWPASGQWNV